MPKLPTRSELIELVRRSWPWLIVILVPLLVFGPRHVTYYAGSFGGARLADDTRIVLFHFYHYSDPALFARDVLGKYEVDLTGELFRWLYIVAAKLGDPLTLSRLLPLPLLLATLAGLAVAGRNLAGRAGALVAVMLCLGAAVVHERMVGGLPRAFAYPVLAWCLAMLTGGRVRAFIAILIAGASLYPVCATLGGLTLAIWLLLLSAADRGQAEAWSLRKRLVVLGVTGAVVVAVLVPTAWRVSEYGQAIRPGMVREFPEAGPGGRLASRDRAPFPPFFAAASGMVQESLVAGNHPLVPAIAVPLRKNHWLHATLLSLLAWALALGCARLGRVSAPARRLAVFALATGAGYVLADAVTPALVMPQRYVQYAVPLLVPLAIAAGLAGLFPGRLMAEGATGRRAAVARAMFLLLTGALLLVSLVGNGPPDHFPTYYLKHRERPLYDAISELPKSALVAGWPLGAMDNVPLATQRQAFLTREAHMPYHTGMTLLLRERMSALIAAYFATDDASLLRLRDQYGVTHLMIEQTRLRGAHLTYFRPFNREIRRAIARAQGHELAVERHLADASVFQDGGYALLDLSRIGRR